MGRARDRASADLNGQEFILDADADTSISADTDDQIDIKIAGADDFQFTANTFTAQSGSTIAAQALTATTVTATGDVSLDGGNFVFNESSADVDFRVEGNGDANALFVEGESDNVGIGNNDPLVKLDVIGSNSPAATSGTSQNGSLRLGQSSGNGVVDMGFDTTNTIGWIQATNKANLGTNYTLNLNPNGGDVKIGAGDIFFGGSGKGINLGVTSNTDSNTLDDYEEGTFTTAFTFSTSGSISLNSSYTTMRYTKVGRLVTVNGDLRLNGASSPTGALRINVPFTSQDTSAGIAAQLGLLITHSVAKQTGQLGNMLVVAGDNLSYITIQYETATTRTGGSAENYGLASGDEFLVTIQYTAT